MSFFFFWQQSGGEEVWQTALADHRDSLIRDKRPAFVTVLDVDAAIDGSMTREQMDALRYRGPFYADWDGELPVVITKVKEFAAKLEEMGVDLDCVRWFATGGRGFHAEIPMAVFVEKPSPKGITNLPYIYKEMVFGVYTDTMDLNVYSARKGRMWRTPGVQRSNGKYKIQLTAQEVRDMTVESYEALCAAPRTATATAPVFSHALAVLFAKCQMKVDGAVKNRKSAEVDKNLLLRFGGGFPPTIQALMRGENVNPDSGFHMIALQIAIAANALGKKEDEVLKLCEGLVQNHQSEGYRYNTPAKRREELQRLIRYTHDNPCYAYSKGGIKSVVSKTADTSDLNGLAESAGAVTATADDDDHGLLGSISMREGGIFCKDAEGVIKAISNISFSDTSVLKTLPDGDAPAEVWGFDTIVNVRGVPVGRKLIENDIFSSRQKLNNFAMKVAGLMTGSDNQTAAITQLLHAQAVKSGKVQYVVRREGLDYVLNPDTKTHDLVWVGGGRVSWAKDTPPPYAYRSIQSAHGLFGSLLADEEMLEGSTEEEAVIRGMLKMNDPAQLGKLIGWFTAAFHRQLYSVCTDRAFPLCQVYGQAGSGKTQTVMALSQLHYGVNDERHLLSAAGPTPFAIETHIVSSASVPVVLDEYKPRSTDLARLQKLQEMFRNTYDNKLSSRGGGGDSGGAKDYRVLSQEILSAPLLFIGEGLESQTATMERCVIVNMSKVGITGRSQHFDLVKRNRQVLSRIGKTILAASLHIDTSDGPSFFQKTYLDPALSEARDILNSAIDDRPMYNMAVTIAGFDFFSSIVRSVFGDKLDEEIAVVRNAFRTTDAATQFSPATSIVVLAEASKVLDLLSLISRTEEGFSPYKLAEGKDFAYSNQGGINCIDLNMQNCYFKYRSWSKVKGTEILYDNYESFYAGLANYRPVKNTLCVDSPLGNETGKTKIYRFDLKLLDEEGVGQFRGQN